MDTQTKYWGAIASPDSTEVTNLSTVLDSKLILNSDKTFKMEAMLLSLDGTWSNSGDQLTLKTNFMGQTSDQILSYRIVGIRLTTVEQHTGKTSNETYDWIVNVYNKQ